MFEQRDYENFLRDRFPDLFQSVARILGDDDEAAVVAQRLILNTYFESSRTEI